MRTCALTSCLLSGSLPSFYFCFCLALNVTLNRRPLSSLTTVTCRPSRAEISGTVHSWYIFTLVFMPSTGQDRLIRPPISTPKALLNVRSFVHHLNTFSPAVQCSPISYVSCSDKYTPNIVLPINVYSKFPWRFEQRRMSRAVSILIDWIHSELTCFGLIYPILPRLL